MRTRALIMSTLLTAALATGCADGDSETDPPEGATSTGPAAVAEAVDSLDLTCEFEPHEDPELAGLGIATLYGVNTTDARIDSLSVTMTLEGPDGGTETTTDVLHFMPGEELAQWTPVFEEYDGELSGDCGVTQVSGDEQADAPLIDPEGSTCEVLGEPGRWRLAVDLASVQSVPFEDATLVGVVVEVDGRRYALNEVELDAGELEVQSTTNAQDEPLCSVRYLRDA